MGKVWHYCVVVMDICFLVGLPPSVIRAVVMCMLMTAARAAGERTLSLNTLSVAAFFMLLYNPFYLFDTGFQLSFLAVLSILFVYPVIFRCWRVRHPVPRYIWGIVAVSLAAQLGTAPVVIYKFAYFLFIFTGQSDSGTFSACYNLWIGSKFCLVSFYGIAYMGGKRIERGVAVAE